MRRLIRRPGFWVALTLACFAFNLMAAVVTVHNHLDIPSGNFFSPRSLDESTFRKMYDDHVPESVLWHRMLQEQSPECVPAPLFPKYTLINSTIGLRANSFRQDVHRYLQSNNSIQKCFFPPEKACLVTKYSVVIVSEGDNLRTLFLNIMVFISYPSVKDITLILKKENYNITKDTQYGWRLVKWNKQGKVNLISEGTLWTSIQRVQPKSEAVLWINGDKRKHWNGTSLKSHLKVFKEKSSSLIAARLQDHGACKLPKLHGLFIHRNLLCYLSHPAVGRLRLHSQRLKWDAAQDAVGILWEVLSDGHVMGANLGSSDVSMENEAVIKEVIDYLGCPCGLQSKSTMTSSASNFTCDGWSRF